MSLAALSGMTNSKQSSSQTVLVFANGEKIADWVVTTRAEFHVVIPTSVAKKAPALAINTKDAKSYVAESVRYKR